MVAERQNVIGDFGLAAPADPSMRPAQMSAYIVVSAKVMESSMHRRNILAAALASATPLFSAARAHAAVPDATKVVYHLDDLDKVDFVLGNIGAVPTE
jgi:hypothetical protein